MVLPHPADAASLPASLLRALSQQQQQHLQVNPAPLSFFFKLKCATEASFTFYPIQPPTIVRMLILLSDPYCSCIPQSNFGEFICWLSQCTINSSTSRGLHEKWKLEEDGSSCCLYCIARCCFRCLCRVVAQYKEVKSTSKEVENAQPIV